ILERAREHVMDTGLAVRRRRAFVEDEARPLPRRSEHAAEHVLAPPQLEDFLLERRSVVPGIDWFEHRSFPRSLKKGQTPFLARPIQESSTHTHARETSAECLRSVPGRRGSRYHPASPLPCGKRPRELSGAQLGSVTR